MTKAKAVPKKLEKIIISLKKQLALMPAAPTEVEQEQLIRACINEIAPAAKLTQADIHIIYDILHAEAEMGRALKSPTKDLHRPLSVPNEKYPCISEHSEAIVWQTFTRIRPELIALLDADHTGKMTEEQLSEFMLLHIKLIHEKLQLKLNSRELSLVHVIVMDDILGLGPLEQLLADPAVTDILVNGFDKVYIERNGLLRRCLLSFRDDEHLIHVIQRVVTKVGRRIDYASPYVDARLKDGSRVNAIIPPLAIDAPSLSIRRFGKRRIYLDHMVKSGSMSLKMASFLSLAVRAKLNIIVSGGTGSGKTTLLNAMSWAIDVNERIVTIEDSAELKLKQPHVVRLETRKISAEGRGEVREQHLVKNALRMRPDRIILGEVRGAEAFDMIQAMNTGHSGSMCTIHANSVDEVASRLCNMVSMSEAEHSEDITLKQLSQVLHIIVQVSRMRDGRRRIVNISEVTGNTIGHKLELIPLFVFEYDEAADYEEVVGHYRQLQKQAPTRCLNEAIVSGMHSELLSLFEEK